MACRRKRNHRHISRCQRGRGMGAMMALLVVAFTLPSQPIEGIGKSVATARGLGGINEVRLRCEVSVIIIYTDIL